MKKENQRKNKKGDFLMPKVLEIILAVLWIVLLIVLGVKLLPLILPNPLNEAKSSLDLIYSSINNNIAQNKIEETILEIPNPANWIIMGYNKNSNFLISQCKTSSCICVCKTQIECDQSKNTGICYAIDELSSPFGPIVIKKDGTTFIKISFNKNIENDNLNFFIEEKK